ncbi:MAG: porphobilinogen synthase [Bacteroidetes bacterium]|nr:porphobilinogen synthase [Bacteroidota bacterium]
MMQRRNRTLRQSSAIRELVAETILQPHDFIVPLFVTDGTDVREEISSMPGYYRLSLDTLHAEIKALWHLGIRAVLLFVKVPDHLKDDRCSEALNKDGLMIRAIKTVKDSSPEMCVMTDVALDPFSPHGHDGLVRGQEIINDETVAVLSEMSVLHATYGADIVAPSDMMDGRVGAIRTALEQSHLTKTGILSYSAKYASCFYGPFRDALDSAPGFGDKKSYQMDPRNRREALKEVNDDIAEGADIVMVKPAGAYLDIIRDVKNEVNVPVAAYQVSGEYAMIKAAAANGWLNEEAAVRESLIAIKRAGADLIATYFAKQYLQSL